METRTTTELQEHSLARQEKGDAMRRMCDTLAIPRPEHFSVEEDILLELTVPYRQLCKKTAEARMDALMLPVLLHEKISAQESTKDLRLQQIRHGAGLAGASIVTAVLEFVLNALTTGIDIFVRAIDRTIGGVLIIFWMSFLASALIQTMLLNRGGVPFSFSSVLGIVGYSLWTSTLFAGLAGVIWCVQQARQRRASTTNTAVPRPVCEHTTPSD